MNRKCRCDDCVGGLDRRQEIRHGGVTEEELPWKGPRKKTRKWCKGKRGVKHVWEIRQPYAWTETTAEVCVNCGKFGKIFWKFNY